MYTRRILLAEQICELFNDLIGFLIKHKKIILMLLFLQSNHIVIELVEIERLN